ncbi:MAG: DUF5362 family protein [Polaribacter sp.]|uniref:DUF5362 family protein n=1 Tax=Polaribacter sp. TaxID=1920175 RepID=UPI0026322536|nr:DUF5362 family protein [Polaribacter sp.]MDG1196338.1 DUF5362 family protein [Polaribacter sp.]MDG1403317.1 DUF5362 family protein [Polaribacter sp.]
MIHNPITELEQLTLTSASKTFLKETAKWTKFLAILGFVFIGFMLVLAIFTTTIYEYAVIIKPDLPRGLGLVMMITYLLLAFIYFFPVYYLLKFSNQLKKALSTKNDEILAKAFEMLKSHYKFIGVFTIITISLYVLLAIVAMMGAL